MLIEAQPDIGGQVQSLDDAVNGYIPSKDTLVREQHIPVLNSGIRNSAARVFYVVTGHLTSL
jgi:hypothetical protein